MITACRDIKRNIKNRHFVFYDTAPFDVSLNISASSDRRKMCHSSLESSHNGESNGGKIVFLQSLDVEILSETSKIGILYFYDTASFDVLLNILASNDARRM